MSKLPKIIDNKRKTLLDSLVEVSKNYDEISIATGYWDLEATKLLLPHLKNYKKIRLLIGREPLIPRYHIDAVEPDFPDADIFEDLQRLKINSDLLPVVKDLKKMKDEKILEVKVYKSNFLHAKCYIFGNFETEHAVGVIGSSNFTKNGLTTNHELNTGEDDQRVVQFNPKNKDQEHGHLSWFEEVWTDEGCEEWTGKFIELLDTSIHGEYLFSPYEMYIHSLYRIYKDEISENINVHEDSEAVLYGFQLRNASLLLKKLSRTGVAMLADSVGLGKTITAGAVIRKYIENPLLKRARIEVLVPASLTSQWSKELEEYHKIVASLDNVCITSVHNKNELNKRKDIDKHKPVDLFVIDEAHNLRNQNSQRYNDVIEWIKNNDQCHVLLMTATPINNQLSDFASQINFASGGNEDLFYVPLPKMGGRQQVIKEHYDAIMDLDKEIIREVNKGKKLDTVKISQVMRPILQHFMVRSTRSGIEKEFGGIPDKDGNLLKFPKAKALEESYKFIDELNLFDDVGAVDIPIKEMLSKDIESIIENKQLSKHPLDMINDFSDVENFDFTPIHKAFLLTTFLGLPIYRPSLYQHRFYNAKTIDNVNEILKKIKNKKEKFDIKHQMTMHNMMRILYLKRAESSVYALKKTLEYYNERLLTFENFLKEEGKIVRISNLKGYAEMLENTGSSNSENKNVEEITIDADPDLYDIEQLLKDIEKDKRIIKVLVTVLDKLVQTDDKLDHFVKILNKYNKEGKKVLVFSYYSDTITFLEDMLPSKCKFINNDSAGFTSGSTNNDPEKLAKLFSPKSKKYELKPGEHELQYLFSTDVLSEGQNLQDCAVLVNYDLHWNPVRMIQRNGRINRLGSMHSKVYIHNLCPADEIELYLKLEKRLKRKIEVIKASVGTDQSILGEHDNPIEFNDQDDLELSLKIYDSKTDLDNLIEEYEEKTDILATEDVFVADLRRFDNTASEEEKKRVYYRIPYGKWGVMPKENINSDTPEVLTNTFIKIKEGDSEQELPLFLALPKNGNTIKFIDRLEALNMLKSEINTKNSKIDFANIKKEKISDMLDENILQIARQSIVKPQNKLKPSHETVLDKLHKMKLPNHLVEKAIKEHRNRHDRNYLLLRLTRLHGDIKEGKPLNDETLTQLINKAEKIDHILNKKSENKVEIDKDPLIYSYHAKPE